MDDGNKGFREKDPRPEVRGKCGMTGEDKAVVRDSAGLTQKGGVWDEPDPPIVDGLQCGACPLTGRTSSITATTSLSCVARSPTRAWTSFTSTHPSTARPPTMCCSRARQERSHRPRSEPSEIL